MAALMLLGTILTACGGGSGKETTAGGIGDAGSTGAATQAVGETKGGESQAAQPDGNPDHIIVTYLYMTTEPKDLGKVQDKVNEITIPAINVEVEFKPLGIGESFTNYSLWISSGEVVDLMMLAFQDIKTYANSGQIEPLDALVSAQTTPTTAKLLDEFPIGTTVQKELFGLQPVSVNYGSKPGLIIRKDYLEETGAPQKDIYSMEDITNIFAKIKENHPDCYPFGVLGSGITAGTSIYSMLHTLDYVGGNVITGVLMDTASEDIVNLFTTEEYKAFLKQMADWYNAGYILPDAATTDTSSTELLQTSKTACYAMHQKPEQFGGGSYDFDLAGLPTASAYIGASSSGAGGTSWVVPVTAKNPEAAMRFMDYLYENHDLSNLIYAGILGEHVQFADEENGVIEFANGYDGNTSPYYNSLGLWGDRRYEYTFDANATRKEHDAFTNEAMSNKFKSYGFTFDSANVSNQIIACQSVLDQYQKALETGTLGDGWEKAYGDMIKQLDTAGIQDVIDECKKQFSEFLNH